MPLGTDTFIKKFAIKHAKGCAIKIKALSELACVDPHLAMILVSSCPITLLPYLWSHLPPNLGTEAFKIFDTAMENARLAIIDPDDLRLAAR